MIPNTKMAYRLTEFDRWVESLGLEFKPIPDRDTDADGYYEFRGDILVGTVLLRRSGGYDLVGDMNRSWGECDCCNEEPSSYESYAVLPFAELMRTKGKDK